MITSAKRRDGCRHRRAEPGVIAAIYLMSSRELIPQARHGSKNTPVNLSVSSKPNVRSGRHMAGFVILNTTGSPFPPLYSGSLYLLEALK